MTKLLCAYSRATVPDSVISSFERTGLISQVYNGHYTLFVNLSKASLLLNRYKTSLTQHPLYETLLATPPMQRVYSNVIVPDVSYNERMRTYFRRRRFVINDMSSKYIQQVFDFRNSSNEINRNNEQRIITTVPPPPQIPSEILIFFPFAVNSQPSPNMFQ